MRYYERIFCSFVLSDISRYIHMRTYGDKRDIAVEQAARMQICWINRGEEKANEEYRVHRYIPDVRTYIHALIKHST